MSSLLNALIPADVPPKTVLIVDDNPPTRYATARVLRAAGYVTCEAATGSHALSVADESIAAIILDVHLPDMNGFDVCRELRARDTTTHLPVIHLSAAYVEDHDKVRGLNSGADAYMTHPADPDLLLATLNALIRARSAEEGMRRSEARFRAIYQHAPNGICLLDTNGFFIDVNPAMLALLRRDKSSVIGRHITDFSPPTAAEVIREYLSLHEQCVCRGEFPLLDGDGQLVHLEWNLSAQLEPGVSLIIVSNISEHVALASQRKELLEREQAARITLERANRAKDEFAALFSHELRTPLNAIQMWVEILKQNATETTLIRGLHVIDNNVKTQARLISDILDVSRLAAGKLSLDLKTVDVVDLVKLAVQSLQDSAVKKSLKVSIDVIAPIRPIVADSIRLQQIVWNLLTNAIKFSHPNGRIFLGLEQDRSQLTLTVRDEGIGVEPEFQPYLFTRYFQSSTAKNRLHGGLGLGLSIVKQLVELHDGVLSMFSAGLNCGSEFTVRIPNSADGQKASTDLPFYSPPHADVDDGTTQVMERQGPSPENNYSFSNTNLSGLSIVVVEDDIDALTMLCMIMRERGAKVSGACDFNEGLRRIRSMQPDVLISDIGLLGRDGYELIRQVRREEQTSSKHLTAIAVTAFARPHDIDLALSAGFDAHFSKPVQPSELIAAIVKLAYSDPAASSCNTD